MQLSAAEYDQRNGVSLESRRVGRSLHATEEAYGNCENLRNCKIVQKRPARAEDEVHIPQGCESPQIWGDFGETSGVGSGVGLACLEVTSRCLEVWPLPAE